MELKPGYKSTELGLLPENWNVVPLGSIGEALIGLTYKPTDVARYGTLVLRSSNIQNGVLSFDDNVYVTCDVPDRIMVQPGDVLVCVRNGSRPLIGKTALLDERAGGMTFGAFMAVFRSNCGSFINYLFKSHLLKRQINEHLGATINQITNRSLKSFVVPMPPDADEVKQITGALSDVDALLDGLGRLIAKKRDIKQATMQRLLTGKTRLPGFSAAWDDVQLRSISSSESGGTPPISNPQFFGGGIPWVSIADMTGVGKCVAFTERTLSHAGLATSAAKMWPTGTILYAMYASLGECAIAACQLCSSQAILGIQPHAGVDRDYLYYQLVSRKVRVRQTAQHGTQPNLNADMVRSFDIPLPPLDEQQAIAAELADMDAEIDALERRRAKTHDLKIAMMQELLTGKTRLVSKPERRKPALATP
tara:strand:- start:5990 stop:7252 length:1263 start_codon:yes stop_codon:yes gene_type:complete